MAAKKPKRGGRREGAGRPPEDPSGAKLKKTLWLTPAEVAHLERLGGVTAHVRKLLAADMDKSPD